MKISALIENCRFSEFIKAEEIIFDPNDDYSPDKEWI